MVEWAQVLFKCMVHSDDICGWGQYDTWLGRVAWLNLDLILLEPHHSETAMRCLNGTRAFSSMGFSPEYCVKNESICHGMQSSPLFAMAIPV